MPQRLTMAREAPVFLGVREEVHHLHPLVLGPVDAGHVGKVHPGVACMCHIDASGTGQIASAAFSRLTKINATAVPYKSSPQVLTDLIGGQLTFLFGDLASSAAHIKSGQIRAIAVSTERRSALAPDLPSVASAANLPGFDLAAWVGIVGPAQMPADITQKLSLEINRVVARKDISDKLLAMGAEPAPALAPEFGDYMRRQLIVWGQKTKDAGIQPE